ncbi:Ig-like domain-containing protein [Glycomyces sp. TRM65418]|uniref:LamG-like jellyroll fold domain-containing protein n=1 Tax=Glycomyces sp. TRM65418 TaxID=2867006 RepID=UPI001CE6A8C3|nr:LamG-like jellyroll fold domain-containing protein [Glycomyces sp. TRM65418]MCC3765133.1 Ig-like domain-containing protein [Glycomyces sp. TRM65418]QZD54761.1 Ig-like domain-containing protein [Glycomyces sp. TRM65418]
MKSRSRPAARAASAIAALAILPLAAVPAAANPLDEHLILSYSFDEGQVADGVVDDRSASGLDGRVVNPGQAPLVPGRAYGSSAIDLTGGSASSTSAPYVEIPHGLFADRAEMTIATWLRWDGGPDFQWAYNLGKDHASATFLTPSYQGPATNRSSIKPVNGGGEVGVDGTGGLPAGEWVQAVTAIDGEQIAYYLNGVEVGRTEARLDLAAAMHDPNGTTSGFIGKAFWGGHPFFDGAVDEFQVYDLALDADQVAELYGGELPVLQGLDQDAFAARTIAGEAPVLPASAPGAFSDGIGRNVGLDWDDIPADAYAGPGTFTVSGTVVGHDLAVTATVEVVENALTVDLGESTGDFLGGASGTLYGLYDEGLPSENLIDGIDLASVATKAQDGPQHPGADALEVLGPLVEASNGDVYIYMTDIHRGFPYQWPGDTPEEKLDTYLEKIRHQAEQVATLPAGQQSNVVFMPYNEPEGNMFGTGQWSYNGTSWLDDPRDFFAAWDRAYEVIHSVLPDARIGGPNTSLLYEQVKGFMEHTVEAGTVPDTVVWHELSDPAKIRANVDEYRAWEAEVFAGTEYEGTELPINISEYAFNYHTSVPGQMIQWIAALEDSKVYGDIAYWNIDGNLSDSAVQANRANGQWWLLHAYSRMSGQTLEVTPPKPGESYTLQGVATFDEGLRQTRVLLGGASGDHTLRLGDVPASVFGDSVHVTVREIEWSGQIGDSAQPDVIAELDVPVSGGDAALHFGAGDLPELDAESSYEVIVTPGADTGSPAVPRTAWEATYEAEDAAFQGSGLHVNGPEGSPSNVAKFYTSGGHNVGGMRTGADNGLAFTVDVPRDGTYDLSVFASSLNTDPEVGAQGPTNLFLTVDGEAEQEVFLPLGYKWVVWDHADTTVELTAGEHVIALTTKSPSGNGAISGDVIIDKIDLALPHPDHAHDAYEAEYAELGGGAAPYYGTASGASVPKGATATFWIYSPADAGALLDVGDGKVALEVNGETVKTRRDGTVDAFLLGGVNKITVQGAKGLKVDRLTVAASDALDASVYEAEDADIAGTATATDRSLASGGEAVTGIGGEPGNGNTLTFDAVEVPEAGRYALTFRYSNEEQSPATHYNPDPVARYALVSVNGADPIRVIFPHSFHENNFWELTVVVDLAEGVNAIAIGGEEKPQFDGATYASDTWPGVLLRSQYAPDLDRIAVTPLSD